MNKKFFAGLFAAASMLLGTSCSNDELIEQTSDDIATVSFTINSEGEVATRAISDGKSATDLYFFVYRVDGDHYFSVDQSVYEAYPYSALNCGKTELALDPSDNKMKKTITLKLAKNQNYVMGLFAKSGNAPYEIAEEGGKPYMKVNYTQVVNNSDAYDAFFACKDFTVSGTSQSMEITLKRPFAQVNVGTSDYQKFHNASQVHIAASSVTINNAATKLCLIDGSVSDPQTYTFVNNAGDLFSGQNNSNGPTESLTVNNVPYTWLSMTYVLPYSSPDASASTTVSAEFTLDASRGSGNNITLKDGSLSNMPIQRNYRTNIIGNLLTSDVDFNVVIEPMFNGDTWDGTTVSQSLTVDAQGVYHIKSAADFALLMQQSQNLSVSNNYLNKTIVLDNDISFGGKTITGLGDESKHVTFTFDGQGHTISDFLINRSSSSYYAGLFSYVMYGGVKNLNVKNATIIGPGMVGGVVGAVYGDGGAYVKNCHTENCIIVASDKKAGGVVGYAANNANVTNCSAKNVKVYCEISANDQSGEVVGYSTGNPNVADNTYDNVVVTRGYRATLVSTMNELKNALPSRVGGQIIDAGVVVLTKDIDMTGWSTIVDGNYCKFVIDGNGHTLRNLSEPLYKYLGVGTYKVRNLNVDDAEISCPQNGTMGGFAGVLVAEVQCNGGIDMTIENCNINNPEIHAYKYAGAFIGFAGGYADNANIVIKDSKISNCNISTDDSSCGGFIGHTWANVTIENCNIEGVNTIGCADNRQGEAAKAGYFIGTVNAGTTNLVGLHPSDCNVTLNNTNSSGTSYDNCIGRVIAGASVTVR